MIGDDPLTDALEWIEYARDHDDWALLARAETAIRQGQADVSRLLVRVDQVVNEREMARAEIMPTGYVRILGDPNLGTPGGLYRVIPHTRKKPLPPGVLHASLHRVPENP